jgi:nitroreductase
MTDTYLVLVMSNPVPGRDAEYNSWYENPHLDQVIESAGFRTAQRFHLDAEQGVSSPHRYLALYETDGASADEVLERLNRSRPERVQSDAIDAPGAGVWVFTPTGELHTAAGGGADPGLFAIMSTCRAMRRLKPDPIPESLIRRLIEAANFGASGRNMQRARWIVVRDAEQKQRIAELNRRASEDPAREMIESAESLPHFDGAKRRRMYQAVLWQAEHMHEAPALFVPCAVLDEPTQDPNRFGSSIWPGVQNLLLAARASGLGAALTTYALQYREELEEALDLPTGVVAQAVIPVGYPVGRFGPVSRRPIDEILMFDRWDPDPGA